MIRANSLYITTTACKVERYDVANQALLAPLNVGVPLYGADTTVNNAFLYAAGDPAPGGVGAVRKIDLANGAVTPLTYGTAGAEGRSTDIAIGANGVAFFSSNSSHYPDTSLWRIDLSSDAISLESTASEISLMTRGADRSRTLFQVADSNRGLTFTYTASSNSLSAVRESGVIVRGPRAVNRVGSLMAMELDNDVAVFDKNFHAVEDFADLAGGFAFSPTQDLFLAADSTNDVLIAYDTDTWAEKFRIAAEEDIGPSNATSPAPPEVDFWVDLFINHGLTSESMAAGFVGSPEYFRKPTKGNGNVTQWLTAAFAEINHRPITLAEIEAIVPSIK